MYKRKLRLLSPLHKSKINILKLIVMSHPSNKINSMPTPYTLPSKKEKRILYKECQIAGITFRDLTDIWNELYVGASLALVRHKSNKHDKNAVAIALAYDYDGNADDFDFDYILGYIPRTDNEYLAIMLDMGWDEVFECELSQVNGSNPYQGSLFIKIYIVNKEDEKLENTDHLLRAMKLNETTFNYFTSSIAENGCVYFRWGGFPPWELNLPQKRNKVVFLHTKNEQSTLYLTYCIAVGDDEASFFVKDKDSLFSIDDCCYYVFTNIKGPIQVDNDKITFLNSEVVGNTQADRVLSEKASCQLNSLFCIM